MPLRQKTFEASRAGCATGQKKKQPFELNAPAPHEEPPEKPVPGKARNLPGLTAPAFDAKDTLSQ